MENLFRISLLCLILCSCENKLDYKVADNESGRVLMDLKSELDSTEYSNVKLMYRLLVARENDEDIDMQTMEAFGVRYSELNFRDLIEFEKDFFNKPKDDL